MYIFDGDLGIAFDISVNGNRPVVRVSQIGFGLVLW